MSIAFYPGRFQPFHKNHLNRTKQILSQNEKLIIGIRDTKLDRKNPFNAFQRESIINEVLRDKINKIEIKIIPDLNDNWYAQLTNLNLKFDKLYAGNPLLKNPFKFNEIKIIHLSKKTDKYKLSGTLIRKRLRQGLSISAFVPKQVEALILKYWKENKNE